MTRFPEHPGFSDEEKEWFENMCGSFEDGEELSLFSAYYNGIPCTLIVKVVHAEPTLVSNIYDFVPYAIMLTPTMLDHVTDIFGKSVQEMKRPNSGHSDKTEK